MGPPCYRHGLLSRTDMLRGAVVPLRYRVSGADHPQMERLRTRVAAACRSWPVDPGDRDPGQPRVVNPDRALRRIATAREWPVLSFSIE